MDLTMSEASEFVLTAIEEERYKEDEEDDGEEARPA